MNAIITRLVSPTAVVLAFVAISQACWGVYPATGVAPTAIFAVLWSLGNFWAIAWWVEANSRVGRVEWPSDMGSLLDLGWPVILPYHLLRTRGVMGLLLIVGFIVLCWAGAVSGAVMAMLLGVHPRL